jgi:hypothetical protein
MNYIRILATLAMLTITACSVASSSPKAENSSSILPKAATRNYAQNYKDMALAYCVAKAYAADPHANADATATAGGLDQWTRYDAERSTNAIPSLAKRYLSRSYTSILGVNVKLNLMKCIDMYHSKELSTLVQKYVQNPQHTYEQDNRPDQH